MSRSPVAMFQWTASGDEKELDAIVNELKSCLATSAGLGIRIPHIAKLTSHATTGAAMLEDLCSLLRDNPHVQVVYFSAHGKKDQTFTNNAGASVTFKEFGERLASCFERGDVELVFGACHAMASGIETFIPDKVRWIWGFTEEPLPVDVICLMAAVIEDLVRLHNASSDANAAYSAALSANQGGIVRAEDFFGPALDAHLPEIDMWFNHARGNRGPLWMMERDSTMPGRWSNPKRFA